MKVTNAQLFRQNDANAHEWSHMWTIRLRGFWFLSRANYKSLKHMIEMAKLFDRDALVKFETVNGVTCLKVYI